MKNISTGTGLCVLGLCLASYPVLDRVMPKADASATHAAAVLAAATSQAGPTIVWYGMCNIGEWMIFGRAWSDGTLEMKRNNSSSGGSWCTDFQVCNSPWIVVSAPNQGFSASSDINFDEKVDGADLGQLLSAWGDAPRQDIPPSTCPLNLINP
jgi:hypothetical protein